MERTHTHTHTRTHTHAHTRTHARRNTHTHTHIRTRNQLLDSSDYLDTSTAYVQAQPWLPKREGMDREQVQQGAQRSMLRVCHSYALHVCVRRIWVQAHTPHTRTCVSLAVMSIDTAMDTGCSESPSCRASSTSCCEQHTQTRTHTHTHTCTSCGHETAGNVQFTFASLVSVARWLTAGCIEEVRATARF